ncbi:MAG: DEAD/DEAH box helicase [Thermodesulfobacteriota bacterium]
MASSLKPILAQIGPPPARPFKPDPFQLQAVAEIEGFDVLVCAPTGSGKTWIALEAIEKRLFGGKRTWYASPLKALSNAKYDEFRLRFGDHRVGILTGDRKENPSAPVIVGTTEILRNQLYDAMERGEDLKVDFLVVDEAHYLKDPDRGVVWEEVLIYLPARVRLLLLSATVGNPGDLCEWLTKIRGVPCKLVESPQRPVPLHAIVLRPDGHVLPLLGRRGMDRAVVQFLKQEGDGTGRRRAFKDLETVVEGLRGLDLLPAIFFLKSRAECDRAVEGFRGGPRPPEEQEETWTALEPFLREAPILRANRQLKALLRYRVASHHAGQLPQWKLMIEKLMNAGQVDAIFSTSTVAAGVDFPARTVVVVQSDRFDGRRFVPLGATELQQMSGRAGRRGRDAVGFALFLPGAHQDMARMARLMRSKPEAIESQIQVNFSMALNLLMSHRPPEIRYLLDRSLAAHQGGRLRQGKAQGSSAGPGDVSVPWGGARRRGRPAKGSAWAGGHSLSSRRLHRGRLFLHQDGSVYVALHMAERRGNPICMAHRLDRKLKVRKGRVILKGVRLSQIQAVVQGRLDLPEVDEIGAIEEALQRVDLEAVRDRLLLPGWDKGPYPWAPWHDLPSPPPSRDGDEEGSWLWRDFMRHVRFLKETGFVDAKDRLTPDGRWASRLRLEHPVLLAEAIRRGALEGRSVAVLAGLVAPFVTDRERELYLSDTGLAEMADAFDQLVESVCGMARLMQSRGFPVPALQFWPAAALYLWGKGVDWQELRRAIPLDEGDSVSLIVRTADHLRQVCELSETHPHLALTARLALRRIQREPAFYP